MTAWLLPIQLLCEASTTAAKKAYHYCWLGPQTRREPSAKPLVEWAGTMSRACAMCFKARWLSVRKTGMQSSFASTGACSRSLARSTKPSSKGKRIWRKSKGPKSKPPYRRRRKISECLYTIQGELQEARLSLDYLIFSLKWHRSHYSADHACFIQA